MKSLLTAVVFALSLSAQAEVITCSFTEPFVSFSYNTATETLQENEAVMNVNKTVKNVSFQIKYAGTFLLKNKAGKLIAELKLTNKGSDGMSGTIYPYEATYFRNVIENGSFKIVGGCTSSLKPIVGEEN